MKVLYNTQAIDTLITHRVKQKSIASKTSVSRNIVVLPGNNLNWYFEVTTGSFIKFELIIRGNGIGVRNANYPEIFVQMKIRYIKMSCVVHCGGNLDKQS